MKAPVLSAEQAQSGKLQAGIVPGAA